MRFINGIFYPVIRGWVFWPASFGMFDGVCGVLCADSKAFFGST
jgi:hypothetical protein